MGFYSPGECFLSLPKKKRKEGGKAHLECMKDKILTILENILIII